MATLDPAMISIAAAHSITPRVAATWSQTLLRTPRVLVPIELGVLMVRDATLTWAATGMATPQKPASGSDTPPTPAASLLPAPFTDLPAPRPRGAYLQWYLPNGLTSGTVDSGTGDATFPPIPDRWLVLRISPGEIVGRRAVRGWVLEAGSEPAEVTDLDSWTEPETAPDVENPLTALGHGDVSWAGYFDNVVNRLGFYDGSLDADKITGPLAYLVCGWYADPTADPLGDQKITSLAAFNAAMQQLAWTLEDGDLDEVTTRMRSYVLAATSVGLQSRLDSRIAATSATPTVDSSGGYITGGSWWPTGCVLHGAVVGIDWPGTGDTEEVGGPPDPATVTVAVGNTMAETIGALVALANDAPDQAALVEALQLGVVKELDQPDGRAELDVALHTSSFASQSGGTAAQEPVDIAPSGPPQAPAQNPPPGPGIFSGQSGPVTAGGQLGVIQHPLHEQQVSMMTTSERISPGVQAENTIISQRLSGVMTELGVGPTLPPTDPGGTIDALRALPRFFLPKDPILLVQGGKRAFVHDNSVATRNGQVICRLTPVSELSWQVQDNPERFSASGADVLERGVENGSIPVECEGLLQETALLDTGSAPALAAAGPVSQAGPPSTSAIAAAQQNIAVEQTAWYSLRNPNVDHAPLLAHSGIAGMLPAPFAVAPAARPWTPMHLEWSVEFVPSPNGVADWRLDQLDYVLNDKATVPAAGTGVTCTGRSPVTGGASATLAAAINNALDQASRVAGTGGVPVPVTAGGLRQREAFYSPEAQQLLAQFQGMQVATPSGSGGSDGASPGELSDIATALAQMDVLSCGLDSLLTQLRGGVPADGTSTAPGGVVPSPFFAVRAGFLRFVRLRLVDGFGQFIDLCGSSATTAAQGYIVSGPLTVQGQPDVAGLPPRFTAPTRGWFRFMSADTPGKEADYQTSPVCGFVLPNHLDSSLEFFNADGSGAGSLQPLPSGQVAWQDAPGNSTGAGQDPGTALNSTYTAQLARSLIDWGVADAGQDREAAFRALLRTIDSTLWAVDPFGHAGDEHLSLLLGHPICVLRAQVRLDVADPVVTADGTVTAVPVRLGDLTQWQDGLLGYFAGDDYTVLHVADASAPAMARQVGPQQGFLQQINLVPGFYDTFADDLTGGASTGATPVTHPYLDTSGVLWIRPNQTIDLILLVEPLTAVHSTLGLVPRKDIGMRRSWVQNGLAAIAPTFQFGPVLVDPQHIRMPLATDLNGTWVWDYRSDATTWTQDPTTNATDDALLQIDPPTAIEGWLKLEPPSAGGSTSP
jgi:hypothetical protein